ncbi:acyl-CoA dehydrogenase family protein [Bosea sp. BK604]|uniref:acyl-CoA dehydrogenase family protein n=1 Tax=Bosea sp. BK604 TaxID=2512180 RepID=UPI001052D0A1|nr:acyl-CoA dehydrogenase family protein [Bosea sp. BK604]TCR66434.1 putative acyl-CoA dehydrogenase [Bosea sp. BK604]
MLATEARIYPTTTHEVTNQSGALTGVNLFGQDAILRDTVLREGAGWVAEPAALLGEAAGDPVWQDHAHLANQNGPCFKSHDRFGHRIDLVEFHPSYHALMGLAFGSGVHSLGWTANRPGAHTARAALSYLWNQIENGVGCPTGMAYSAIPALRLVPEIQAAWEAKVLADAYDPRPLPIAEKAGATIGMALTEKQGGSDLRANATRAIPVNGGSPGGEYRLTGHKWFCSAPMSDAFLTLAQTEKGPSCFFVPRSLPDGTRNRFFIQRLKDKCGNRSNASSEIEYDDTYAVLLGEEGRGVRIAIEMAHLTRLDFAIGSAGLMRWALSLTLHHTHNRRAFQRVLAEQPLMRNVLADLCLESEAATLLAFRLARAVDEAASGSEEARLLERILTPVAKFWNCKRAPAFVAECLECHGGNGFIEEQPMARLYREAPLNGIWEGTGNVICLDVLRALQREPDTLAALLAELSLARGADRRLDLAIDALETELSDTRDQEHRARQIAAQIATVMEAALFARCSTPAAADAFIASRLEGLPNRAFGSLPRDCDLGSIVARSRLT